MTDRLFTRRQMEVCIYYMQGLRRPEIAERMYITPKTVDQHLAGLKKRMKARTLAHLMFMLGKAARE